jgi:hypothetical protein
MKSARIIHVDGGAFIDHANNYKFNNAYFSVCDADGNLIHFAKNIGDLWSGIAEYEAIKWAAENITERPLTITSDCTTTIAWAKKGSSKKSKFKIPALNLDGILLCYQHDNHADRWNAANHSPKKDRNFYFQQWKDREEKASMMKAEAAAARAFKKSS